jgi:hypothetical protein
MSVECVGALSVGELCEHLVCIEYWKRKAEEQMNKEEVFDGDYLALARTPEQNEQQAASNFVWRAMQYIKERRPFEGETLAILNEKCYDIMDACLGPERSKGIN